MAAGEPRQSLAAGWSAPSPALRVKEQAGRGCFPEQLHHFALPPSESQFLHNLSNTGYCLSFYSGFSSGHEVVSPCVFDLRFPVTNDVEYLSVCSLAVFISVLRKPLSRTFVGAACTP